MADAQREAGVLTGQGAWSATDKAFHAKLRQLMTVHGAVMWVASGIAALGFWAMKMYGAGPIGSVAVAATAAGLFGAGGVVITWILIHDTLDLKFRQIRSRAKIGAERINVDDTERAASGVQDVIYEWYHIRETLRSKDITAIIFSFSMLLSGVVLAALAVTYCFAAPVLWAVEPPTAYAIGGLVALIGVGFGVAGALLGQSVRGARCYVTDAVDPSEAIQARMRALLAEVKELRRHGVIAPQSSEASGGASV